MEIVRKILFDRFWLNDSFKIEGKPVDKDVSKTDAKIENCISVLKWLSSKKTKRDNSVEFIFPKDMVDKNFSADCDELALFAASILQTKASIRLEDMNIIGFHRKTVKEDGYMEDYDHCFSSGNRW